MDETEEWTTPKFQNFLNLIRTLTFRRLRQAFDKHIGKDKSMKINQKEKQGKIE